MACGGRCDFAIFCDLATINIFLEIDLVYSDGINQLLPQNAFNRVLWVRE